MKSIKEDTLNEKFKLLGNFNQSESKSWKLLNQMIEPNKPSSNPTNLKLRKPDNTVATKEPDIANLFGEKLEEIFTSEPLSFETNLEAETHDSPFDQQITRDEFLIALKNLNSKATAGLDQINNKILKRCPNNLHIRIFRLFNASLKVGYIPNEWKISKIIMLPKKDKPPDETDSYRPISLISCLAKWLEKIVNNKILTWLEENNYLPPCQSGFRKKMSTHDHFLRLYNSIVNGFNNHENTGVVFFDLEKAFDKINHKAILLKLKNIKINVHLYKWIQNFLSSRQFLVSYKNANSKLFNISSGVPQGSCLSPTLFSIFFSEVTKNIPSRIKKALFADDLSIWFTNKSLKKIEKALQEAINTITNFCSKWNLKINQNKTVYTVFTTAGRRINYEKTYKLNLNINNIAIPIEPYPTFLGHTLDPKLAFKKHLENLSTKLLSKTNIIKRIKNLKIKNKINLCTTIFNSLIRSHFDYLFIALATSTQRIDADLQKIQNRILKSIKWFPFKTRINYIHDKLKIDLLANRNDKLFEKFVAKRLSHQQICDDLNEERSITDPSAKHSTLFDKFRHTAWFLTNNSLI
jgi:hypothetical protein